MSAPRRAPTPLADQIATLRERFRTTAGPAAIARIAAHADALERSATDGAALSELRRELHRLRGTAGSYGFADVGRWAGELERRVIEWMRDSTLATHERAAAVRAFGARASDGLGGGR